MTAAGIWKTFRASLGAAATLCLLAANGAYAVEGVAPADAAPITVYTQDAAALAPGGAAGQLAARARAQGEVRVIVGLRTVMRMEHTLTARQVDAQRAALRRLQDAVISRVLGRARAANAERFTFIPYMSLWVNAAELARLLADPLVVSIEEDVPLRIALAQSVPLIHADDVFARGINGTGYVVAVLDTGVAKTHPMLSGKVLSEACYSTNNAGAEVSSLCPGGVTASTASGSAANCPVTIEGCDHGTHVTSIAAGNSNTFDGVARDSKIIAVQVFSRRDAADDCAPRPTPCVSAFNTNIIKGLERVYDLRNTLKIAAVNMSLGSAKHTGTCNSKVPAMTTAILNLRNAQIPTVIASGNDGYRDAVSFPACISHAVAVGNSTKSDLLATSSNHSPLIDLLAPGSNIRAAVPPGSDCIVGGPHCVKSGTSMAAPHVAGAFALLKNAVPGSPLAPIEQALKCAGKVVNQESGDLGDEEIDPAKPRLDVFGAYLFLRHPPNSLRSWLFDDAAEALDWTPLRGEWAVSGGRYAQTPLEPGGIGTAVANCDTHLEVTARMRRAEPVPPGSPDLSYRSGVWFKTRYDHATDLLSGYFFGFSEEKNPATEQRGLAVAYEAKDFAFSTESCPVAGGCIVERCRTFIPISVNGFNTVEVTSLAGAHTLKLNGTSICTFNDATYKTGSVIVQSRMPPSGFPSAGHSFSVDTMRIKSIAPPASPEADDSESTIMDPTKFAAAR